MTRSLLAVASSAEHAHAALPSLAGLRRSGAWPVGLLPASAIAADLALGAGRDPGNPDDPTGPVAYRRGVGYLVGTTKVSADYVARRVAFILEEVARRLPRTTSVELAGALDVVASERPADIANRRVPEGDASPEAWAATAEIAVVGIRFWSRRLEAQIAAHDPATDVDYDEHRRALRITAREIRASAAARKQLLTSVLPHLPAAASPTQPDSDTTAALAFLATLDAEPKVSRASVVSSYRAHGRPGDLADADLRAAATERWGEPRKLRGEFVYRPSAALAVPAPSSPAQPGPTPEPALTTGPPTAAEVDAAVASGDLEACRALLARLP
jgi:hypothetical protein